MRRIKVKITYNPIYGCREDAKWNERLLFLWRTKTRFAGRFICKLRSWYETILINTPKQRRKRGYEITDVVEIVKERTRAFEKPAWIAKARTTLDNKIRARKLRRWIRTREAKLGSRVFGGTGIVFGICRGIPNHSITIRPANACCDLGSGRGKSLTIKF